MSAKYSHDGNSPKYEILSLFVVGIPDGRSYKSKPITYHASLIHDVFCQFKHDIDITQEATLEIFDDMLKEVNFIPRPIYVAAVKKLGPKVFKGDLKE